MQSPKWNQTPAKYADKVGKSVSTTSTLKKAGGSIAGIAASWLSYQGLQFAQHVASPDNIIIMKATIYIVATISALILAHSLYSWTRWQQIKSRQAQLPNPQRTLLGLPEQPVPITPASELLRQRRVPQMPPPMPQRTPITPASVPSMRMGEPTLPGSARSGISQGIRSPSSASPRHARPGQPLASPQQLKPWLASLTKESYTPGMAGAAAAAYESPVYNTSYYDQQQGSAPALPLGPDAPTYQPSWLLKRNNVVAAAASPNLSLQPSSEEEVAAVLQLLRINRRDLRTWTDRLREWLAAVVLQPLVQQMDSCHQDVNTALAGVGMPAAVAPLRDVINSASNSLAADTENQLQHYLQLCANAKQAAGMAHMHPQVHALMAAATRYQCLLQLLRGRWPEQLLPPCSASYVAARIATLAQGNCLEEFQWNGGGDYGGRSWTTDLPSDSALLLYVFSAFLAAPAWSFPLGGQPDGPSEVTSGMPLYLGRLPQRPPNQYSAILAFRPEPKQLSKDADAIIATCLATAAPLFTFVVDGRLVTLAGRDAMFWAVLLVLQLHKLRFQGMLGKVFLGDVRLSEVIEAVPVSGVLPQRVFSWWFNG